MTGIGVPWPHRCGNPLCTQPTSTRRFACRRCLDRLPDRVRLAVVAGVDGATLDAIRHWRDNP